MEAANSTWPSSDTIQGHSGRLPSAVYALIVLVTFLVIVIISCVVRHRCFQTSGEDYDRDDKRSSIYSEVQDTKNFLVINRQAIMIAERQVPYGNTLLAEDDEGSRAITPLGQTSAISTHVAGGSSSGDDFVARRGSIRSSLSDPAAADLNTERDRPHDCPALFPGSASPKAAFPSSDPYAVNSWMRDSSSAVSLQQRAASRSSLTTSNRDISTRNIPTCRSGEISIQSMSSVRKHSIHSTSIVHADCWPQKRNPTRTSTPSTLPFRRPVSSDSVSLPMSDASHMIISPYSQAQQPPGPGPQHRTATPSRHFITPSKTRNASPPVDSALKDISIL